MKHPQAPIVSAVPHRHPMLLVDRLDPIPGRNPHRAIKAVTGGEAHREADTDPGGNGIPGTLVVDALGQLAIQMLSAGKVSTLPVWYLAAIDAMQFGRSPDPGDVLEMETSLRRTWGGTSRVSVRAEVRGETVAEGTLILSSGKQQSAD